MRHRRPGGGPRFVLFDLYDTLVGFDLPSVERARADVLARCGLTHAALEAAEVATKRQRMRGEFGDLEGELAAVLRAAGVDPDRELLAAFSAAELRAWRDAAIVYDDVVPCLDELRGRQVQLGLISNCTRLTRPLLRDWGLENRFDELILSCEVGYAKPDPAILEQAVGRFGGVPEGGMLIDDMEEYVVAAETYGLAVCHIARGQAAESNGRTVIGDLRQLTDLLAEPGG